MLDVDIDVRHRRRR